MELEFILRTGQMSEQEIVSFEHNGFTYHFKRPMSYTEGSEQEMVLAPWGTSESVYKKSARYEHLQKALQEQLDFAEGRLIEATNQGVTDEQNKWCGYCQALRFIQSEL